ncbi:MAG: flagellar basal body P-ring formation chaperone FlgA [Deltaproteobacteria bacterium]|nr:flagellar basal body P-ring formation chaperone FlgA [Deltaproteobacteria bacterium]
MRAAITLTLAALALCGAPARAHTDELGAVIATLATEDLPPGLGVAEVHLPKPLVGLDAAPDAVTVAWPSPPRAGRPSARVTVRTARGTQRAWVPITLAPLVAVTLATRALAPGDVLAAGDLRRELRAMSGNRTMLDVDALVGGKVTRAIAQGAVVASADVALAPPAARGAEVQVIVHTGAVTATARGTLDRATRPGQPATVRLANRTVIHGTLVDGTTVVVAGVAP